MRAAISLATLAALAACSDAPQQAETNNAAAVTEVEALPPDESAATPTDELANGAVEPVNTAAPQQ